MAFNQPYPMFIFLMINNTIIFSGNVQRKKNDIKNCRQNSALQHQSWTNKKKKGLEIRSPNIWLGLAHKSYESYSSLANLDLTDTIVNAINMMFGVKSDKTTTMSNPHLSLN